MIRPRTRSGLGLFAASAVLAFFPFVAARAQDADAPAADEAAQDYQGDPEWPRVIEDGGLTLSVYQPQIDKFDDDDMEARAAVQIETPVGDKTRTSYGVIWIKAHPFIDKEAGLVQFDDIQIMKASFPTEQKNADQYLDILRRNAERSRTISLERIEANLAVTQEDKKGAAVPLENDPPKIYYRTSPALLLLIDGDPALRPVEGSSLQRVVNTRSLILQDGDRYVMSLAGRWFQAPSPTGPWQLTDSVSAAAQSVRDAIAKDENQTQVDLMVNPDDTVKQLIDKGTAPEIIVSTVPAELLVTQGPPQMKPIEGTRLLYVSNTAGDILLDTTDSSYYAPLTGRWYRARALEGPWEFVDGDALPKDFAKIPSNDPKAGVLATVPGTPAAQEALIANSIPQTAEVNRAEAQYEANYDGEPRFDDVPDTSLQYAINSPTPVVRVSATSYYAVQGGVWFMGDSALGPWSVATEVPAAIYEIPTSSPIHYVTYVRIYRYNPTSVWVGYTPGYLGTCYSPWGTVVYGTGWRYRPWIGTTWYGAPLTWGFGVGIAWDPWNGWDVGFGSFGYRPVYRPWWGPYYGWRSRPRPSYPGRPIVPGRPRNGRPGRVRINEINVYNRPGAPRPGVRPSVQPVARPGVLPGRPGPNARPGGTVIPGRPGSGGRPSVQPNPASRGGAVPARPSTRPARPDNIYAGPDGNVYRPRPTGGWDTRDGSKWKPAQPSRPDARPALEPRPVPRTRPAPAPSRPSIDPRTLNQLSREQQGRQAGDRRVAPPPRAAPSRPAPSRQPAPRSPKPR